MRAVSLGAGVRNTRGDVDAIAKNVVAVDDNTNVYSNPKQDAWPSSTGCSLRHLLLNLNRAGHRIDSTCEHSSACLSGAQRTRSMELVIFKPQLKNPSLHLRHRISGPKRLQFKVEVGISNVCSKVISGREVHFSLQIDR